MKLTPFGFAVIVLIILATVARFSGPHGAGTLAQSATTTASQR